MQLLALMLLVGGWMIAVGGLVASDALAVRLILASLGLATSLGGIATLTSSYIQNASWKKGGALR